MLVVLLTVVAPVCARFEAKPSEGVGSAWNIEREVERVASYGPRRKEAGLGQLRKAKGTEKRQAYLPHDRLDGSLSLLEHESSVVKFLSRRLCFSLPFFQHPITLPLPIRLWRPLLPVPRSGPPDPDALHPRVQLPNFSPQRPDLRQVSKEDVRFPFCSSASGARAVVMRGNGRGNERGGCGRGMDRLDSTSEAGERRGMSVTWERRGGGRLWWEQRRRGVARSMVVVGGVGGVESEGWTEVRWELGRGAGRHRRGVRVRVVRSSMTGEEGDVVNRGGGGGRRGGERCVGGHRLMVER